MVTSPSPPLRAPDPEASRAALEVALDSWKSGHRGSGTLIGSDPAIGVVDTLQAGRILLDYEILGALGALPEARPFAVQLVLDEPFERVSTRYMVLGEDPLWVFRQEDYELILHWEHKMTEAEPDEAEPDEAEPDEAEPDGVFEPSVEE